MSVKRLELLTNGLKGRCSTIELHARRGTFYHAAWDASTDFEAPCVAGITCAGGETDGNPTAGILSGQGISEFVTNFNVFQTISLYHEDDGSQ
jgi:hypothetical protein